jgi:hypothetical protein
MIRFLYKKESNKLYLIKIYCNEEMLYFNYHSKKLFMELKRVLKDKNYALLNIKNDNSVIRKICEERLKEEKITIIRLYRNQEFI